MITRRCVMLNGLDPFALSGLGPDDEFLSTGTNISARRIHSFIRKAILNGLFSTRLQS